MSSVLRSWLLLHDVTVAFDIVSPLDFLELLEECLLDVNVFLVCDIENKDYCVGEFFTEVDVVPSFVGFVCFYRFADSP